MAPRKASKEGTKVAAEEPKPRGTPRAVEEVVVETKIATIVIREVEVGIVTLAEAGRERGRMTGILPEMREIPTGPASTMS